MLLPEARLPHPPFFTPQRAATYVSCASDDLARGGPGSGTVVVEELVVLAENARFEMNDFFSFHASLLGLVGCGEDFELIECGGVDESDGIDGVVEADGVTELDGGIEIDGYGNIES
ncbi:unnamed protein product [Clonostachys chloroleuca]|uniref:Uncharacterized protein n=1 Tax=Clonostachys chloroleuca TaxID=1926264 RepID=A0AA35LY45_9HYPO|nr:unnamed protein product [Clonostachys chloroleuca]